MNVKMAAATSAWAVVRLRSLFALLLCFGSLALSGCNGFCTGQPASILCPNNAPGAVGGTGGGAPAGVGGGTPAGCNPCDDGQGGLLQMPGDHCGGPYTCCQGLTCVGATASEMGTCQGAVQCPQAQAPNWIGLDTATLRKIAIANNINGCASQTGITQSRTIGLAFEAWVLKTMGQLEKRWKMPIVSQERKMKNTSNGGLPASVIPEYVDSQVKFTLSAPLTLTWEYFPNSLFYEVKAVTGNLTLGTRQWQILGLLDAARTFPTVPAGSHAPPAVIFTTTSNTVVSQDVIAQAQASMWGVGVWQQKVFYDANSATPDNPLLHLEKAACLTPSLYPPPVSLTTFYWLDPGASWPDNPLTWVTVPEQDSAVVPGDPDPAEVD